MRSKIKVSQKHRFVRKSSEHHLFSKLYNVTFGLTQPPENNHKSQLGLQPRSNVSCMPACIFPHLLSEKCISTVTF